MTVIALHRRERLAERVYRSLRQEIIDGRLMPDSQISEQDVAARLKVSRTPLREALVRLVEDGLAVVYPQFGTFVAPIRLEAVTEAQFVREHLECAIVREAATRTDARWVRRFRDNLQGQARASAEDDHATFYALDEALHAGFAEAAGRAGVWRMIQQSKVQMDRVRLLSLPMSRQLPLLIEQHHAIVDALAKGDADEAEAALRRHLREVFQTAKTLGLEGEADARLPKRRRRATAPEKG